MHCPLPQATLRDTISLLLLLLLDERGLINYEEGSTLMKAINVLMLKVCFQSTPMYKTWFDLALRPRSRCLRTAACVQCFLG